MANESVEDSTSADDGTVSERKPSASAWPMFVAFGLAIAEVGVVIGVFVLTVVGFVTFTGAVAGILAESGYVESAWVTLAVLAGVVLALGVGVFTAFGGTVAGAEPIVVPNDVAYRGLSLIAAGALTMLTAGVGYLRDEFGTAV